MRRELTSLHALLEARRPGAEVVAFDSAGVSDWQSFAADVRALRDRLRAVRTDRWLVVSEDAYAFAVSLFAVAHAGAVAVLPPNAQAGTLARLAPAGGGFVVDDAAMLGGVATGPVVEPLGRAATDAAIDGEPTTQHAPPLASLGRLDPDAPFVEFFTSGTTGESKCVPKRLRHLNDEVAVLEQVFGESMEDARILATVSHQHIYGALFRVLWPLAARRAFSRRPFLHGSEVVARMADGPSVLVSSPVQLRAMTDAGSLRGVAPAAIFSSGAPLAASTAAAVANATGVAATEVFGSTETGGVAWRQCPMGGDQPWRPLPGVRVERDDETGNLAVRSPFVSVGELHAPGAHRFVMGDRVEIDATGAFTLLGRADRIVKIGSKRLSLAEMEAELARHPSVDEAALVVTRRGMESRVCAAVVLSAAGREQLRAIGRGDVGRTLAASLAPYFDRVHLPRAWRFLESLPRDAQGKLTEVELRTLFSSEAASTPVVAPTVISERRAAGSLDRHCSVPGDLAFLAGHFDAFPVVAGVVQLAWVVAAIEDLLGAPARVAAVEALKFKRPLLPGDEFDLKVTADGDRRCVRFLLSRAPDEISSGRVLLA